MASIEADYFQVMGLDSTATESEIKKQYRKLSLKLHPDKNPNQDPIVAANKFHELKLAYEVLMDPSARLAAQEKLKTEMARRERRGAYEGKRKEMAEDLERRENQDRDKRRKVRDHELELKKTLEKLKEEGRKLREEKDRQKAEEDRKLEIQRSKVQDNEKGNDGNRDVPPPLGPLDLSLLLKFPSSQYESLSNPLSTSSTSSFPITLLSQALSSYGPLTTIIFNPPKPKNKVKKDGSTIQVLSKEASALVTFERLDSAYAAVRDGNHLGFKKEGCEDVWAGWAGAKKEKNMGGDSLPGEPERIKWMRRNGSLGNGESSLKDKDMVGKRTFNGNGKQQESSEPRISLQDEKCSFSFNPTLTSTSTSNPPPTFSFSTTNFKPPSSSSNSNPQASVDYESATLLRLREAERRRVEEEIRESEKD